MKIKYLLGVLLFSILLSSCGAYKAVNIGNVENVNFKGMIDNKISLELQVPVSNPNNYKIKIKTMDFDVSINGNYLGKMKNTNEMIIPKKSDEIQNLVVDIYMKNALAGVATFYRLRKEKKFDMEISGKIKVKALLKTKTIEVSEKQSIDM
ncbi:MAG: hypothetical protein C0597_15840 [Marinilabiliales bacterium]|nr:MAG: hypothetical protein C0597_15840 [Marinilabiliales bacterium]